MKIIFRVLEIQSGNTSDANLNMSNLKAKKPEHSMNNRSMIDEHNDPNRSDNFLINRITQDILPIAK